MRYIFWLLIAASVIGCKEKETKKTTADNYNRADENDTANHYHEPAIGWTTQWPEGWEVQSREMVDANTERGKKAVEKTIDQEVDISGLKNLLHLAKNKTNSFLSTIEPYNVTLAGDYEKNNQRVYQMVKDTYVANGLKVTYEEDSTMIDGLRFYLFRATIYKPNSNDVLMWQDMYSRLINGYDFGATLIYDSPENSATLEKMLFGSRFTIRD